MKAEQHTILLVDDEVGLLSLLTMVFEAEGFKVLRASSGPEALQRFSGSHIDVVVLDYLMPDMNGGEVAHRMREIDASVPIVMLSACLTVPDDVRDRVDMFVEKGFGTKALLSAVTRVLQCSRSSR
jgi:DNA-binding response OmpR family regulator